jgi:hypothetical protein
LGRPAAALSTTSSGFGTYASSRPRKREIVRAFKKFGPGARGIVAVLWRFGGGHVFNLENVGGKVQFVDPQTGEPDVTRYFDHAEWAAYVRVDDATPGSAVLEFAVREGSARPSVTTRRVSSSSTHSLRTGRTEHSALTTG